MASDLNIPQFGTGATPGLNAPRMQAIWTFLKAIGSGGAGSVINSDKLAATTPTAVGLSMLSAADKAAQQALVSLPEVSDSGLVAHWSMDSVPEIPDDPAGVAYLQDVWATVDGWSGNVSASSGTLVFVGAHNGDTQKIISGIGGKEIRLKYKSTVQFIVCEYVGSWGGLVTLPASSDWITVTTPIMNASSAGVLLGTWYGAGTVEIDFIYIGTGAYLPNSLIDNSGNGNHGTIYGATPVKGISGKALAFDGVNDYAQYASKEKTAASFSAFIKTTQVAVVSGVFDERLGGTFKFILGLLNGGAFFQWNNADGAIPVISGGPLINDGNSHHIVATHTGTVARLYVDGVLVSSTSPTSMNNTFITVDGYIGQTISYPFSGTIDEPRIYNRALTAEEVYSLYMSKGRGPDAQVKSVRGVANSLVVRNASGYITDAWSASNDGNGGQPPAPKPRLDAGNGIGVHSSYPSATGDAVAFPNLTGTWYGTSMTQDAVSGLIEDIRYAVGSYPTTAFSGNAGKKNICDFWRIA